MWFIVWLQERPNETLGWISLKKIKSKINELEFFTYTIYSISLDREVAFDARSPTYIFIF